MVPNAGLVPRFRFTTLSTTSHQVAARCQARSRELSAHGGPSMRPRDEALHPDFSRPGNGLEFKRADLERYAV